MTSLKKTRWEALIVSPMFPHGNSSGGILQLKDEPVICGRYYSGVWSHNNLHHR
ncbi:MAG: hypothetical protein K9N51_01815 [Candidatus Pacebacteria bacterium]|nr:hypothetical protein [Candidatus Paceibacterota bacterium]